MNDATANKALVVKALTELFVARDTAAIERYWGATYVQHNPHAPNGREALKALVEASGSEFRYELGMAVAEGDLVMVHGRYQGLGPKPFIAVDIFRVEDGRLVEHWDVTQKEATETTSGNPMFSVAGVPAAVS